MLLRACLRALPYARLIHFRIEPEKLGELGKLGEDILILILVQILRVVILLLFSFEDTMYSVRKQGKSQNTSCAPRALQFSPYI